jgi:hypothetical protein
VRRLVVIVVITGLAVILAGAGSAGPSADRLVKLRADMTPAQENGAPALTRKGEHGLFTATFDKSKATLTWHLTYVRASSPAVAAHIHQGKRGQDGGAYLTLCASEARCKSGAHGTLGKKQAVAAYDLGVILSGTYVELHTRVNSPGEMRGQIRAVR